MKSCRMLIVIMSNRLTSRKLHYLIYVVGIHNLSFSKEEVMTNLSLLS
jgi:hypothetical protein